MSEHRYWCALPTQEIGPKLSARVEQHDKDIQIRPYYERAFRAYQVYYGFSPSGVHATSQVLRGGDQGELAEIRVNHSRSLVGTLLNLVVAPKLSWQPKAVSINHDSLRETELAAAILEYYWQERHVSKYAVRALEEAIVFSEGFVLVEWDKTAGEDVQATPEAYAAALGETAEGAAGDDADAGGPGITKSGDVLLTNVSSWDVLRDPNKQSWDELDWVIVRLRRNKYDLAAQYPDKRDKIHQTAGESRLRIRGVTTQEESDDVPVYTFFHRPTPAVPQGRRTVFVSGECVLEDGELNYETIPLYRVSAGELVGTPYGYTAYHDVLGVQELYDSLQTAVASNQSTLATQCIAVEEGSSVAIDQIAGGMKAIYYPVGGKLPEPLQLLRTPAEVFNHLESLRKEQELLMGLNSVVRGEAQSGEMSGSALALLQSQALQQSSTLQANYLRLVEGIGSCVLYTIQRYCTTPRKIAIAGKTSQALVYDREYDGHAIGRIKKVQVEIGNPLAQTSAGRIEMAKELLQMLGPKLTLEQYQQVLQTGRLEPMTQSLSNELLLIRAENEALARGEAPPVVVIDDHMLHAREHRSVLANPEARRDPGLVQAVLKHIDEHERAYYTAPPQTLMMMGQEPPPMPMGPMPGGEAPPGGPPPAPKGDAAETLAPPGSPPGGDAKLPTQPQNPASGQRWNAVDGGGAVPR